MHYAHSGKKSDRSDWQSLSEHLRAVELLARQRSSAFGLQKVAQLAGRLHDLGKYDPAFDRVLTNTPGPIMDHSTAGGKVLMARVPDCPKPLAEALAYAILGHHAGLPDKSGDDGGTLAQRIERPLSALPSEALDHLPGNFAEQATELAEKLRKDPEKAAFDLSVAVRMIFSSLVDADFRDTESFYASLEGRSHDREWPALKGILSGLRRRFDIHVSGFDTTFELNQLRASILSGVRARACEAPGLFTLSVPTGGGKTLASLGFALDHAARHGHRRIIYAIPYTSIIDQTASIFREVLGHDIVLEHHSTIETEEVGHQGRNKLRLAMEDWAAPVIVTTNVQLFESLFAARSSRCRKLHNIAGSVIVLDEAQCLPRKLLLPTLAMIDALACHYGCTIVLCTATQPAFDSAQLKAGGLPLTGRELAPSPEALVNSLRRARIVLGGEKDDADLVEALRSTSQGFVIVNSRGHALALFEVARDDALEGLAHLSTRQYPAHRRRIIAMIRDRLKLGEPCRLIATSLIEAGVDLDFPRGWRAAAGLDSVIQAAGRVNREGRRPIGESLLTVFSSPGSSPPAEVGGLARTMQAVAANHPDLLTPEAIRDWFEEVYWRAGSSQLDASGIMQSFAFDGRTTDFAFRSVAARYRMIDSPMVPVIIALEDEAVRAVSRLQVEQIPSSSIARSLQPFSVQIPEKAREILRMNGKGDFEAPELRGEQFFVLSDTSLYVEDFGLWWERAEYLGADQSII